MKAKLLEVMPYAAFLTIFCVFYYFMAKIERTSQSIQDQLNFNTASILKNHEKCIEQHNITHTNQADILSNQKLILDTLKK
jgi:hypothetical protein